MGAMDLHKYAVEFARLGGRSKSPKKAAAARRNGKLGGRPRKQRVAQQPKAEAKVT